MDFDLEALVDLEQTFYDSGYQDGFAHGRIHGLIEGRALGREKGFEMWEELGFYEGFALIWQMQSKNEKALSHIKHLLTLISQFPRVNPSSTDESGVDIPKLFRQIRSRYKALCSTLGVKPTLRAVEASPTRPQAIDDDDDEPDAGAVMNKSVWVVDKPTGVSF
ncbi:DUF1715-domain-containing protein [Mycena floridula]|nr:DUF1715-domain-containing protein [Mycena floridula]